MAQGFGHDSWIGFSSESVWGTRVAPAKFLRITEENFKLEQSRIAKPSLGVTSQNRSVKSKRTVSGGFTAQVGFNGIETILKHVFGAVVTSNPAASTYLHTYSLTNALPTGLTFHVNRDAANIGTAYEYEGCMIEKLTFKQELEDILMIQVECQGEDETPIAVVTPTFPTFVSCDWELLGTCTLGGASLKPKSVEVTIENPLAGDRFQLAQRLRKGLGRSAPRRISGKIETEFESVTAYDAFRTLAVTNSVDLLWQGAQIDVGHNYQIGLTFNASAIKAERNVSDAGPIPLTVEFEAFSTADAGNDEVVATLKNTVTSAA